MHHGSIEGWKHSHVFLGDRHEINERRTLFVVGLTAAMMIAEIAGGSVFGSMALIADGWHMATHAGALGAAAAAYAFARRFKNDPRFAFGTGKFGDLAAFSSAISLVMIALFIAYESFVRLSHPVAIAYRQAIPIAVIGLAVNLASAWLLRGGDDRRAAEHAHAHSHAHSHAHGHTHGGDNNLRAAYIHVMADAATSVAAIVGLILARRFNLPFIDPAVALIGTLIILSWAFGLLRDSGAVLLDYAPDPRLGDAIRSRLEIQGDKISDLHLWRVGPGHQAAVISVVSDRPQPPASYKERLADLKGLSHVTIEVSACL
jgi:cation diffusion facilitator family transporter